MWLCSCLCCLLMYVPHALLLRPASTHCGLLVVQTYLSPRMHPGLDD